MAYNSAYTGSQVDAAVGAVRQKETIWDGKQDELTGTEDQLVGFNSAGEATAVPKPTAADVGALPIQTGTQGQVLGFTADNTVGAMDAPIGLPDGGTPGQMLYQGASGPEWGDKPVMYVNVTQNESAWQADKTLSEIHAAYTSGYTVLVNLIRPDSLGTYSIICRMAEAGDTETDHAYFMGVSPSMSCAEYYRVAFNGENSVVVSGPDNLLGSEILYSRTPKIEDGQIVFDEVTVNEKIDEVDSKIIESTSATVTLTASGWTGSAAPFSQQVACSIVAADTAVVAVDVDTPGTDADADAEAINAWALCTQQNPTQGAGTLTFYCREKPTINIPVKVGVS